MGWNGLVISDAYRMSAITKHYTIEQIMENSINAGIDLLLFANDYSDEYIEKIAREKLGMLLPEERIYIEI